MKFKLLKWVKISLVVFAFAVFLFPATRAEAGTEHNLFGYAWSDTVGWISFNNCPNPNTTTDCGSINYGVNLDPITKQVSGWAWSDNVGWISFDPIKWLECPPNASGCNLSNLANYVNKFDANGWAKVYSVASEENRYSKVLDNSLNTGGWDGWISFGDGGTYYSTTVGTTNVASSVASLLGAGNFTGLDVNAVTGYWWSGSNDANVTNGKLGMGWIQLNPSNYGGVFLMNGDTTVGEMTLTPSATTVLSGNTVDFTWARVGTFDPVRCVGLPGSMTSPYSTQTEWVTQKNYSSGTYSGMFPGVHVPPNTTTTFTMTCTDSLNHSASASATVTANFPAGISYTGQCMKSGDPKPKMTWYTDDITPNCSVLAETFDASYNHTYGSLAPAYSPFGYTLTDTNYQDKNTFYKLTCTNGTAPYNASIGPITTFVNMCGPDYTVSNTGICKDSLGTSFSGAQFKKVGNYYEAKTTLSLAPINNYTADTSVTLNTSGGVPSGSFSLTPSTGFKYSGSAFNTLVAQLRLTVAEYNALMNSAGFKNNVLQSISLDLLGASQNIQLKGKTLYYCPAGPAPATCKIASFFPGATNIQSGQSTTLNWSTVGGCTSASIDQGVGTVDPVSGVQTVSPTTSTTYTLSVNDGGANSDSDQVTISVNSVPPPPNICTIKSFRSVPDTLPTGSITKSDLVWVTENCDSVSIDNGIGNVSINTGTWGNLAPSVTTAYHMTAINTNNGTAAYADAWIKVIPPTKCTIDDFHASAYRIQKGDPTDLYWQVGGDCTSVTISGVPTSPALPLLGTRQVSPIKTTKYVLTAKIGTKTEATRELTIEVTTTPPPTCKIMSFIPNPPTVTPGYSNNLDWITENCTSLSITGIGSVSPVDDGFTAVTPPSGVDTTYELVATDGTNYDRAYATITDVSNTSTACTIEWFKASVTVYTAGTPGPSLGWKTKNCDTVNIAGISGPFAVDSGIVQLAPLTSDMTYVLTATKSGVGPSESVTIRYNTTPSPCVINSFIANPAQISSGSSTLSWTTSNCTSVSIDQGVSGPFTASSGSKTVSPTVSTKYRLSATGPSGSPTLDRWVNVDSGGSTCNINSYTANTTRILGSGSATLSWNTSNCTSVTLNQGVGSVTASGNHNTGTINSTRTYTLTATDGTVTRILSMTIQVVPAKACQILMFSPNPPSLPFPSTSTLSWRTINCTSVSINQGVGSVTPVDSGSIPVSVSATTDYTISASNASGNATPVTTRVRVDTLTPSCEVTSFTANPDDLPAGGGSSMLDWTTQNCTSVDITGVPGPLATSGSESVNVSVPTQYTLTAMDGGGNTDVWPLMIGVNQDPICELTSHSASPTSFTAPGSSDISWTSDNCTSAVIAGIGTFNPSDTATVSPSVDTTYRLTVSNATTSEYVDIPISVIPVVTPPNACVIDYFTASPAHISSPASSSLSWETTNCTSVSINQGIGSVTSDGNTSVSPSSTRTYTISASNINGSAQPLDVTVTVGSGSACFIKAFYADPDEVPFGSGTTLRWETQNCTDVSIDRIPAFIGPASDGQVGTAPIVGPGPTQFILTATDGTNNATEYVNVFLLTDPNACRIDDFYPENSSIPILSSTKLHWKTTNCTVISSITNTSVSAPIPLEGETTVSPTFNTTYTLTATDGVNIRSKSTRVEISLVPVCTITSFTSLPSSLLTPGNIVLSWNMSPICTFANIDGAPVNVPSGSMTVYLPSSRTFQLTADGVARRDLYVHVGPLLPGIKPVYKPF